MTRKEIISTFSVTPTQIRTAIFRGKLIEINGDIDLTHPVNNFWFDSRDLLKMSNKLDIKPERAAKQEKMTSDRSELDLTKKRLEIRKLEEDTELARIKKEKMLGLLIPVDLVYPLFSRHFKNVTDTYYQSIDNISIELSARFGVSGTALAEVRDRLRIIINDATSKASDLSRIELNDIIDEFSENKERGERN